MRAGAHIGKLALLVKADNSVIGQVIDKFDFIRLIKLTNKLQRILS
jgi:hypothetical protein